MHAGPPCSQTSPAVSREVAGRQRRCIIYSGGFSVARGGKGKHGVSVSSPPACKWAIRVICCVCFSFHISSWKACLCSTCRWSRWGEAAPVFPQPGLERPAEAEGRVHSSTGVWRWHQLLRQWVHGPESRLAADAEPDPPAEKQLETLKLSCWASSAQHESEK